jgi:hypothetical protein
MERNEIVSGLEYCSAVNSVNINLSGLTLERKYLISGEGKIKGSY